MMSLNWSTQTNKITMTRIEYIIPAVVLLLTGCGRYSDDLVMQPENRPIEIGISDEWTDHTKAAYNQVTDLNGDGFIVWATCNKPEANSSTEVVFGQAGTEVYAPSWTYSPDRYWQKGTYSFAAILPASAFNATHATPSETQVAPYGTQGTNSLTLECGDGYNLATNQDDIMVAFADVDNSESTMGTVVNGQTKKVSLTFKHQLALVKINGVNLETRTDIRIDEITLYGNSASTDGNMVFNYNPADGKITADYDLATPKTTQDKVFRTMSGNDDEWVLPANNEKSLVDDLIVFPESCTFNIVVKYTDLYGNSEIQYTKTGSLSATWEVGKMYTYTFSIDLDNIIFSTPTVAPWPDGTQAFDDAIEM